MSRLLGFATTERQLAAMLAERRRELDISQVVLDDIAGLAERHLAKIECGTKGLGAMSFTALAGALGIVWLAVEGGIVLIADDDALPARTRAAIGTRGLCRDGRKMKILASWMGPGAAAALPSEGGNPPPAAPKPQRRRRGFGGMPGFEIAV